MNKRYIIGVDLGATNIKIGLLLDNKIISKKILPTQNFRSKSQLIAALVKGIKDIALLAISQRAMVCLPIDKAISQRAMVCLPIDKAISRLDDAMIPALNKVRVRILGVGLGLPGLIDYEKGIVHYFPNIRGWRDVPLKKLIHEKTGLPAFVDNDANLMSLAEARLGSAKGKKNIIGITLGTGVGGGILVNSLLYRGTSFASGEIGHIPLNINGPRCNCGGRACLERYIGNRYILDKAKKTFGKGISLEELSRLSRQGNKKARRIWEDVAEYLGIALVGVVNFFNPEVIVIGGGIAYAGQVIFDNVRRVIKERAMPVQANTVKIVRASLGNDAGMIGAGLLVKEGLRK